MSEMNIDGPTLPIIGYKVLENDYTCRGFGYGLGNIYFQEGVPKVGAYGFHFCELPDQLLKYPGGPDVHYVLVHAYGPTVRHVHASVTNCIQIMREMTWDEIIADFKRRHEGIDTIQFDDGTVYLKNGLIHRDRDCPAIEKTNGTKCWYQNGRLHRDRNRPAIIHSHGAKEWYQNGVLRRNGKNPAIEW